MKLDSDYKIIDTLHESSSTIVCRAIRLKDEHKVILKILKQSFRDSHKLSQFVNEKEILAQMKSRHIVVLLETISTPQVYCHVFDDIGGDSLYNHLHSDSFEMSEALYIAKSILETLSYIHKKQVIHADINPKNIIYNKQTKNIQIIDFGLSIGSSSMINMHETNHSSGNLYYISPEQTGLTYYTISKVSDIYSCGMSLYHLFSSNMPFSATDMDELVHKQIAQEPQSLLEINSLFPPVLAKIIEKMIEKSPNKRYQEAQAIVYDLQKCITFLDKSKSIQNFDIGTKDTKLLDFSQKIYGRDTELEKLEKIAQSVSFGREVIVLISGESGVGKTVLAEKYLKFFDMQKFNILRTKFDEYEMNISFSGCKQLIVAFSNILISKCIEGEKELISKESIQVLCSFFPSLSRIFKMENKDLLNLKQDKELSYAVSELLDKIATQENPLIIYLDDLQWIDVESAQLIKKGILNNPYVHLVFSYRLNTIEPYHGAFDIIQSIKNLKKTLVVDIVLQLLNVEQVNGMIEALLEKSFEEVIELSRVIHTKTAGNSFYIRAFLEYLLANGLLSYRQGSWSFDINEISSLSASINIAKVVISRFELLSKKEKLYLEYLATLGYSFKLDIAIDMMKSIGFSSVKLRNIYNNGFIELDKDEYSFIHDKIREYVMDAISATEARSIHLKIGNYLEKLYHKGLYNDVITVTKHLNKAYLKGKAPKKLFTLNYLSLEELLDKNTYKGALYHAKWIAQEVNIDELYKSMPMKAFKYELLYVRALYGNSYLNLAYEKIKNLMKRAKTIHQNLECFSLFKDISVTDGKYFKEAMKYGTEILKSLNVTVPNSKSILDTQNNKIKEYISSYKFSKSAQEIVKLKQIKKGRSKTISSILVDFWELAYYESNLELMQWSSLLIVHNSLKYGNSVESSFGYVLYGSFLIKEGEYKRAYIFGQVALKLVNAFADTTMLPKIYNFVANFISPYSKPLMKNITLYKTSLEQSKRNGDIVFGTWANFLMHFTHFLSGYSLDTLKQNIHLESQFILDSGDTKMIGVFKILRKSIDELQGSQVETKVDEEKLLKEWHEEDFKPALAWYGLIKAELSFLSHKFDKGLKYLDMHVKLLENGVIMFPIIHIHFIRAVLLLSKIEKLSSIQEKNLKDDITQLFSYAKASPKVFKFKKLLIDALIAQKTSTTWKVGELYDKALKEAKSENNPFYITLAGLCAGNFWSTLEYKDITKIYLNEAVVGLNNWGAYSLSEKLKARIESFDTGNKKAILKDDIDSSSRYVTSNIKNVLQAVNEISQSTNSHTLITKLMKIILQIAKSSRGLLILKEEDIFYVRAEIDFNTEDISVVKKELATYDDIPKEMLYYGVNTQENIIAINPAQSGAFQYNVYIKRKKPASIIVIPIKIDGLVTGVLYLEDKKLDIGVSDESLNVLHLLLTQAVIIFQNTQLIEKISINERSLNQAQLISHTGSWQFDSSTLQIVWSQETYRIFDLEPFSVDVDNDLFFSFIHPDDRKNVSKSVDAALSKTSVYSVRHRIVTAKGVEKYVHQEAEFIVENGVKKLFGTIQDITVQVMKDKMLILQNRQAQMGEMISMIAHQWRQPLTVISTIVSTQTLYLALDKFDLKKLPEAFNDINAQVQHLSKTVDDFRNFFKPNKEMSFINFEKLVNNAVKLIKHSFDNKSIKTEITIKKEVEFKSFENELQQVILNIFTNAQDAYEDKIMSNKLIRITIDADDEFSYLHIEDNAGGIDKDVLNTLFLPYISTKLEKNGTGLGLYMSKTIVEEHCSGSIVAQNIDDGALFIVKIPLKNK
ncbi:protein kinase [Sulfurimonas sp. SAG-AH-194-L11]|nr:protein kinase [Sulfurimonas sp. SAG-AH-194-L11]MDF1877102.1 protein kinase [Sulfurimonas sp. SAG-AH-194-L11]